MKHAIPIIVLFSCLFIGCAGKQNGNHKSGPSETFSGQSSYPAVTLTQEAATLGETVRALGERYPGGIVVMNGIQEKGLPPLAWNRKPYDAAVRELAALTESQVAFRADYYFLYPLGYESLATYNLKAQLSQSFITPQLECDIGAGTALYDALSLLSYHTRKTIVASNIIAEELTGEVALSAVSPVHAVEALLQSARVPEARLHITATEAYLAIDAANVPPRDSFRLGDAEEDPLLSKMITATLPTLPESVEGFVFYGAPSPLDEMLVALSLQAEVRIMCDPALEDVPVNPCTFVDLPLGKVLDLLLWQWPVRGFGYEVRNGEVLIRAAE